MSDHYETSTFFTNVAEFLNAPVPEQLQHNLLTYADELTSWSAVYHLIGPGAKAELFTRHFADAVSMLPYMKDAKEILDIGSGGGLPGIVLALFLPNTVGLTLLDSAEKKCRFLRHMVQKLKLPNVQVVQRRAEEYIRIRHEAMDIVTLRAVAPVTLCSKLAEPFLRNQGSCLLPKGIGVGLELADFALSPMASRYLKPEQHRADLNPESVLIRLVKNVSRET